MRSLLLLAVLPACLEPPPPPLHVEAAPTIEAAIVVPDEAPREPQLVILHEDDGSLRVKALGLPAVRVDGRAIAFVEAEADSSELVTIDLAHIERSDRRALEDDAFDRDAHYEQRLGRRVHEYNAELRDHRAMALLDVVVVDRERAGEADPSTILPAHAVEPSDRPVQAIFEGDRLTISVPGVRVLSQQSLTEPCAPHLRELWGDRDSGAGVAVFDHARCDEGVTLQPIELPPAVFDELAQRPSERYLQLVDAACERVC